MTSVQLNTKALDFEAFCRSSDAWNELVAASDQPTPFMCSPWLQHWWRHFGAENEFVALTVSDADGSLLAGVPLVLRSVRALGFRLTLAEFAGTGSVPTRGMGLSDKADLLVRSDQPAARDALVTALYGLFDRIDILDLKGFDAQSATRDALKRLAPPRYRVRVVNRSVSPYLGLTSTWGEYLAGRSRSFRKQLRRYRKWIEETEQCGIERMSAGDDMSKWMRDLRDVNRDSWTAERGTNLFRSQELFEFFTDVVSEMASRNWVDLRLLRVDDRPVAYELCFDFAGRLFSYNGSYRRSFAKVSPGTILTAEVIESAYRQGHAEYDMLRGGEEYKLRWSDTARSESRALITANSLPARAFVRLAVLVKESLRKQAWLVELADRVSGWFSRRRYRD